MTDSITHKRLRVRPPRVNLTYEIEGGGALRVRELPFVIGVLADLGGDAGRPLKDRSFAAVDLDRFDALLESVRPRLSIEVPDHLGGGGAQTLELQFRRLEDFEPQALLERVAPLARAYAEREARRRERRPVEELDVRLRAQLDAILHSASFQRLEASWRSLLRLASRCSDESVQIRVLDARPAELARDFRASTEFAESHLWKLVYEHEYGVYGGDPYALLVGDFEFGAAPRDVELLEGISAVAAASNAPFVAGASPAMFEAERFGELLGRRGLSDVFGSPTHAKWRSFRESEDSRWVGLTLPRCLVRSPHRVRAEEDGGFTYLEDVGAGGLEVLCWGNAAFAFAERLAEAFVRYHWCASFLGLDAGLVQDLPRLSDPDASRGPLDCHFGDRHELELSQLGFVPLLLHPNQEHAVFFSAWSCQRPRRFESSEDNARAALMSRFPYLMVTSRFAHYIRMLTRDRVGSFHSRGDMERYLNAWLSGYVAAEAQSDAERAQRPLSEARIEVFDDRGRPGTYRAAIYLRPNFQVDELQVSFRLVTELPTSAFS